MQHKSKAVELFTSIDNLPQWNWEQVHKTENLAFIKKLDSYRNLAEDYSGPLQELWLSIYDEYLEEFGLSKEYKELLEKRKEIARLKNQFIITEDRTILNFIKIEEIELKASFDNTQSMSFEAVVSGIEKIQGFKIDVKSITVYEYNNYLRTLKK